MAKKPYVLLDRDGTLIVERNYLSDPEQVELLPGAAVGLRRFTELGFGLVVVTNQSGLGRGYFGWPALHAVHDRMKAMLSAEGVVFDGIYVCPHTPDDHCDCRKPKPGLINQAVADLGFDPRNCFVIGDKPCDIDLGRGVGAQTVLVRTGYGSKHEIELTLRLNFVADNLTDAAEAIAALLQKNPLPSPETATLAKK
jgi:D-glycero-D-manno-heptose 1,7-bisphosphate phosphatase